MVNGILILLIETFFSEIEFGKIFNPLITLEIRLFRLAEAAWEVVRFNAFKE